MTSSVPRLDRLGVNRQGYRNRYMLGGYHGSGGNWRNHCYHGAKNQNPNSGPDPHYQRIDEHLDYRFVSVQVLAGVDDVEILERSRMVRDDSIGLLACLEEFLSGEHLPDWLPIFVHIQNRIRDLVVRILFF